MYFNVSRGASPSATALRASKVDLEILEELQDAWCKRYEMLRDPPPPPQLNSPRSLRACAIGNVDPQYALQKLSLKQHLFRVLGNANMLGALPKPSTTEYRVLMQSALRSFQEATIGLGTSQEKLAAYIAFRHQEELRCSQLASLRELRRQLIAEEVFEERKRHHHERSRRASDEPGVSVRGANSVTRRRGSSAHSNDASISSQNNALWSSTVEAESGRSRHASVNSQHQQESNAGNTAAGQQLVSPVSATLSGGRGTKAAPPLSSFSTSPQNRGGAADFSFTSLTADSLGDGVVHGGRGDFTPALSPSGKLPYIPRDVTSLNSSYFGNRSIQSNVSNPSGAPLPSSSVNNSALSPAPRPPVLAQKQQPQPSLNRRPRVPPPPQPPSQNLHKALSESVGDADREMSIGNSPHDQPEFESVPKQDLSVVSLNSNQLDMLLNPVEAMRSTMPLSGAVEQEQKQIDDTTGEGGTAATHPVKLFHDADNANGGCAVVAGVPRSTAPGPPSSLLAKAGPSPSSTTTTTVAAADAKPINPTAVTSALSSQPLTSRGRRGYTNHLNSPMQLVPNGFPRNRTPLASSNVSVSDCTPTPEDRDISAAAAAPSSEGERTSPFPKKQSGTTRTDVAQACLLPPAITPAEWEEGFVYYCANPTRSVTKFYGGARFPIADTVKL
jgi:hypothetical protein